ncbi:MAG: hypothetical protein WCK77_19325 [Verrucomicrobiota bacterium]
MRFSQIALLGALLEGMSIAADKSPDKETRTVVKSITNDPVNCHTAFIVRLDAEGRLRIEMLKSKGASSWSDIKAKVMNSENDYKKDLSGVVGKAFLICVFDEIVDGVEMGTWRHFQITGDYVLVAKRGYVSIKSVFPSNAGTLHEKDADRIKGNGSSSTPAPDDRRSTPK